MGLRGKRGWSATLRGGMRILAFLSTQIVLLAAFARADEAEPIALARPPDPGWRQTWTGVDAHSNGWLVYGGSTAAPFTDIYSEGLRLRATTGYGGYGWEGGRRDLNHPEVPPPRGDATTNYLDFLAGYYKQFGPATIKVFGGVAKIEHNLGTIICKAPKGKICDSDTIAKVHSDLVNGMDWGPKASFEIWLNIGTDAYASFDASYTTAFNTYGSHARLGYRFLPTISAGLEAAINGNAQGDSNNDNLRGGMFVRYEWFSGEISASGGLSIGDIGNIKEQSFYATVNWATHY